jgi:hypothetical protein
LRATLPGLVMPARTLRMLNIPPISTGPNGPAPEEVLRDVALADAPLEEAQELAMILDEHALHVGVDGNNGIAHLAFLGAFIAC